MPDLRQMIQALTPSVPLPVGINTTTSVNGIDAGGDVLVYEPPNVDIYVTGGNFLPLAGGTMLGSLYLAHDPVQPLEAATKEYVDNAVGAEGGPFLKLSGGVMAGPLHMATNLLDNASTDGNDTAVIVPEWTPCWPVGNSPDPSLGAGENAVRSQFVVQAQSRLPTGFQEWTAVFGNYVNTGAPLGQKVSLYAGAVQGPLGGPAWAINSVSVRNGVPGSGSNVPGGPSHIGSSTPGTPGAMSSQTATIGYELDYSNWDQDAPPGGAFTVGMFISTLSRFASLAGIYYDSTPMAGNYGWHNGIYFAGALTVQDNTIYDASNAQYSYQATGTRGGATFYSNDTAPLALAIGGNHSGADIQVLDNAPVVLSVYGGSHNSIVDVTNTTVNGVAWNGTFSASAINNTPIGGTTPQPGTFSYLTVTTGNGLNAAGTQTLYLGNAARGGALAIADGGGPTANLLELIPGTPGFGPELRVIGSDANAPLNLYAAGTAQIVLQSPTSVSGNLSVNGPGSYAGGLTANGDIQSLGTNRVIAGALTAGNAILLTPGAPGSGIATIHCGGTDANVTLQFGAIGNGIFNFLGPVQSQGPLTAQQGATVTGNLTASGNINANNFQATIGVNWIRDAATSFQAWVGSGNFNLVDNIASAFVFTAASATRQLTVGYNLICSGTVSGPGFTGLFAAPPAIGSTTPNAASVTGLTVTTGTGINASGTNTLYLGNTTRGGIVAVTDPGGAVANLLQLYGNTTGFGPTLAAIGSDTNINLNLYAKGTGVIALQSGATVNPNNSSVVGLQFNGTSQNSIYCADTAQHGIIFGGTHSNSDIWVVDNAPIVALIGGSHTNVIDVSGATISGVAWNGNLSATAFVVSAAAGPTIRSGAGAPTGTQPTGSIWLRTDGAVGTHLYISAGGGTWNPVAGA